MRRISFLALSLAFFCSPALAGTGSVKLDLNSLETATISDLEAARVDAAAHNDTLAETCYAGVEAYVEANPITAPIVNVVGVASAFQTARDGVKLAETTVSNGIPPAIEVACGPLALDVQSDLGKAATGFTFLGFRF